MYRFTLKENLNKIFELMLNKNFKYDVYFIFLEYLKKRLKEIKLKFFVFMIRMELKIFDNLFFFLRHRNKMYKIKKNCSVKIFLQI